MPQRWYYTPTFKISVVIAILAGVFGIVQVILPLIFQRSNQKQVPIIIHGGEGGKGVAPVEVQVSQSAQSDQSTCEVARVDALLC